jgi:hypothetical protein
MAWVKLDDSMPTHPKLMAAGPVAFALDVAGICYSNRHSTDGFIATHTLPALFPGLPNPRKIADRLVEVSRWREVDGGWVIHDVHDYQPTAEQQKELSRKRAEAGRRGGSKPASKTEANGKQLASGALNPVPSRPVPSKDQTLAPPKATRKPDLIFDALVNVCGLNPGELTKSGRGALNRATSELREIGATPEGITARAKVHRQRWPGAELTPSSLAKNYAQLGVDPSRKIRAVPSPDACGKCKRPLLEHDVELCAILERAG